MPKKAAFRMKLLRRLAALIKRGVKPSGRRLLHEPAKSLMMRTRGAIGPRIERKLLNMGYDPAADLPSRVTGPLQAGMGKSYEDLIQQINTVLGGGKPGTISEAARRLQEQRNAAIMRKILGE
jgi:hypothetical protein